MRSSEQMSLSVLHLKNQSTLVLIYDVPIKPFYGLSSVLTHYFPANDLYEMHIITAENLFLYDWVR
jgi:hypothetical protein